MIINSFNNAADEERKDRRKGIASTVILAFVVIFCAVAVIVHTLESRDQSVFDAQTLAQTKMTAFTERMSEHGYHLEERRSYNAYTVEGIDDRITISMHEESRFEVTISINADYFYENLNDFKDVFEDRQLIDDVVAQRIREIIEEKSVEITKLYESAMLSVNGIGISDEGRVHFQEAIMRAVTDGYSDELFDGNLKVGIDCVKDDEYTFISITITE